MLTVSSVWLRLLKENKAELNSPLLTETKVDHRSLLKYLGGGWAKGDAKMQLWSKKSKVLWFCLKSGDL